MKKILFYTALLWANIALAQYTEWHVAVNGTATGLGNQASPWDLQTALNKPNTVVKPGDTVWLHGGIYVGRFSSNLTGTATDYITVSSYPGEWAIINGNLSNMSTNPAPLACVTPPPSLPIPEEVIEYTPILENLSSYDDDEEINANPILSITGGYIILKNFEICFLGHYNRIKYDTNPSAFQQIVGINHSPQYLAKKAKFINLIIKNIPGSGIGSWKTADNSEIYGCIIYNNGYVWFNSDNPNQNGHYPIFGKGTGIYTQNSSTNIMNPRLIKNNIVHNNYDSGILVWSAATQPIGDYIKNYEISDNIIFNNGNPARKHYSNDATNTGGDSKPGIVIDSYSTNEINHPTNINVSNNVFYLNSLGYISGMRVGGSSNNVNINNNMIIKGAKGAAFSKNNIGLNFTTNLYWGKAIDFGATPESYIENLWNFNFNKYHVWNYTRNEMCHIPNPDYINEEITPNQSILKVHFNDFKLRYPLVEIGPGNGNPYSPNIFGGNGLFYFNSEATQWSNYFSSKIKVTQNQYNPNLFYVTLFNTEGDNSSITSLPVDFSTFNIPNNSSYKIRDIHNYANSNITGTYNGSPLNFSLVLQDVEFPNGYYENATCIQFTRKRDFAVYSIEFSCPNLEYDKQIQNQTDTTSKSYLIKNNITLGTNYIADVNADVIANASKQIKVISNAHFKAGSKVHLKIQDPCPDIEYVSQGIQSRMANSNQETETKKTEEELVLIYPNPNSGVFTVESQSEQKIKNIKISDINTAKIIFEQNYEPKKAIDINISNERDGLYIVQTTFEDNSTVIKTIIKK